jgi:hypothetical protein
MVRAIVKVVLEGELGKITSTISSRAVSGSMTTVKVSPAAGVIVASSAVAELTTIVVAPADNAVVSVVSCEMDE